MGIKKHSQQKKTNVHSMKEHPKDFIIIGLILLFFLGLGLWRLNEIPGEWYGDISIVNIYVQAILDGRWPFIFIAGGGPLYHYLISPIIFFIGVNYMHYKYISLFVGAVGLIPIYLFAKEISTRKIALLTTFLTAFSFWYFVWARIGNYNIFSPIITAAMMFFLLRYIHARSPRNLVLGIFFASCGLFLYPGVFILPLVFLSILGYSFFVKDISSSRWKILGVAMLGFLLAFCLFIFLIIHNIDNFGSGYIGTKIFAVSQFTPQEFLMRLGANILKTLGMLHIAGDVVFRTNIPYSPHIDHISGLFFLVGLVALFFKRKKMLGYLLLPIFILPLFSIWPGNPSIEIPNSSRTMAIIPFVFLITAYGVQETFILIRKKLGQPVTYIFISILLASSIFMNMYRYFVLYPETLPNHNTPFGKIIAREIDALPAHTVAYLTASGWGDWAQPELDGIYYVLQNPSMRESFSNIISYPSCKRIDTSKNAYIIFNPSDTTLLQKFLKCFPQGKLRIYRENSYIIFQALYIDKK